MLTKCWQQVYAVSNLVHLLAILKLFGPLGELELATGILHLEGLVLENQIIIISQREYCPIIRHNLPVVIPMLVRPFVHLVSETENVRIQKRTETDANL